MALPPFEDRLQDVVYYLRITALGVVGLLSVLSCASGAANVGHFDIVVCGA